jgi:hypothetical protein
MKIIFLRFKTKSYENSATDLGLKFEPIIYKTAIENRIRSGIRNTLKDHTKIYNTAKSQIDRPVFVQYR